MRSHKEVVFWRQRWGLGVETPIRSPVRQTLTTHLIDSVGPRRLCVLPIDYNSVAVLTTCSAVVFRKSVPTASGSNTWYWLADAVALVIPGCPSDNLLVHTPFIMAGALVTMVVAIAFIQMTHPPHTSTNDLVEVGALVGITLALADLAWMAAYTEAFKASTQPTPRRLSRCGTDPQDSGGRLLLGTAIPHEHDQASGR